MVKTFWAPKRKVWFKHNDDSTLGAAQDQDDFNIAEEFISKRFPKEAHESYKEEWRERFRKGRPEMHMDSQSKKVYKQILAKKARKL